MRKYYYFMRLLSAAALLFHINLYAEEPNPITWSSAPKIDDQIIMKVGHSINIDWTSHTATLKRFSELVQIYTNNEIKAEIFPGSQLGGEREMVQQAQQGILHVTLPATNNIATLAPSLNILVLPYLAKSTEEMNYLQDKLTPVLVPRVLEEAGVRIVGWENSGWRLLFYKSDTAIEKPADIANLKMRVPPNPLMIEAYKAWGGNPTPLAWNELYNALQQGVVEGGDNPITDIIGMRFNEVINRITTFHYMILTHPIVVSERWYQSLSEQNQAAIQRAGQEATDYIRWWQPIDESNWMQKAIDGGVQISAIEDETEWSDKARAIWPNFYAEIGKDGEDLVNQALSIIEEFQSNKK